MGLQVQLHEVVRLDCLQDQVLEVAVIRLLFEIEMVDVIEEQINRIKFLASSALDFGQ